MNSMPSTLARIMRLTALELPPPTPMTLIFAGDSSSLKLMRIALSFAVICSPRPIDSAGKPVCEAWLRETLRQDAVVEILGSAWGGLRKTTASLGGDLAQRWTAPV